MQCAFDGRNIKEALTYSHIVGIINTVSSLGMRPPFGIKGVNSISKIETISSKIVS